MGKALSWYLRACAEEPNQREPWTGLSDYLRERGDHAGSYWTAKKALEISADRSSKTYLNDQDCWGYKPHDLAGVAAFYMGLQSEALHHTWKTLEAQPWIEDRLINNYCLTQEALVPEPSTKQPLISAIILSYAKTKREYDMVCREIKSLRRSSPNVPLEVVVVETNTKVGGETFATKPLFGTGVKVVLPDTPFAYNEFLALGYAICSPKSEYILILNNDIAAFSPGFLQELLNGLQSVASVSAWGLREAAWGLLDANQPLNINFDVNRALCGWCLMFNRRILRSVPFDVLFPKEIRWYGQDVHYGRMLDERGYKHALVVAAKALHLQQQSKDLMFAMKPPASREMMLKELGVEGKDCVEVGVDRGNFSAVILGNNPKSLLLVDPWKHQDESVYPFDGCNLDDDALDLKAKHVAERFAADKRVKIAREFSVVEAKKLAGFLFGIVYIDAIHTKKQCRDDMEAWLPLVAPKGYLCGHDYSVPDVSAAVWEFLDAHRELSLMATTLDTPPSWIIQIPEKKPK